MTTKLIKTQEDYKAALSEVEQLMESAVTSDEYDRLELMAALIENYEAKHYPIEAPDPIAAIEYEMEKRGMSRRDLEPILGPSGRVSEVMNRQRRLTVSMMRRLHTRLGIPGNVLLNEYPLAK